MANTIPPDQEEPAAGVDGPILAFMQATTQRLNEVEQKLKEVEQRNQVLALEVYTRAMNNLVVQENAPVVGKKITVAPLYSVITGDLITPFPKTTDEIRALHIEEATRILKEAGLPCEGLCHELTKRVALACGVARSWR